MNKYDTKSNIYLETYGCSNNQAESEIMAGLLSRAGFNITKSIELADALIINTCVVKKPTSEKMVSRINELKKYKKKLIIAGCMPLVEYDVIKRTAPNASLIDTHHITEIAKAMQKIFAGKQVELIGKKLEDRLCLPRIRRNPIIGIVPISCGCLSNCNYCIVKQVKGELFSYPEEKILREISLARSAGCKEFWLTSQDNACYGFDLGTNLAELLNKITNEIKGNYFIRVGMMNPAHLKRFFFELIEAYDNEKVFKFLHLPVQSGSDEVLKAMNRGYRVNDFKKIVSAFRKKFPEITLVTDIIVGFPGESDSDFLASYNLIRKIKPDFVNISKYFPRPKTKAMELEQLPQDVIKERSVKISQLVKEISTEQNKKWLNWSGSVLVDEYNFEKKNFIARNFAYKPIIIKGKFHIGDTINVKVTYANQIIIGEPQ